MPLEEALGHDQRKTTDREADELCKVHECIRSHQAAECLAALIEDERDRGSAEQG